VFVCEFKFVVIACRVKTTQLETQSFPLKYAFKRAIIVVTTNVQYNYKHVRRQMPTGHCFRRSGIFQPCYLIFLLSIFATAFHPLVVIVA